MESRTGCFGTERSGEHGGKLDGEAGEAMVVEAQQMEGRGRPVQSIADPFGEAHVLAKPNLQIRQRNIPPDRRQRRLMLPLRIRHSREQSLRQGRAEPLRTPSSIARSERRLAPHRTRAERGEGHPARFEPAHQRAGVIPGELHLPRPEAGRVRPENDEHSGRPIVELAHEQRVEGRVRQAALLRPVAHMLRRGHLQPRPFRGLRGVARGHDHLRQHAGETMHRRLVEIPAHRLLDHIRTPAARAAVRMGRGKIDRLFLDALRRAKPHRFPRHAGMNKQHIRAD
ncbi:MAG: hypothetical protein ABI680_05970 [Chthoniobacteraceae bacterium]